MIPPSDNGVEDGNRFHWEQQLVARGLHFIVGIDEAGRGPLAGPVVAGAAMLPEYWYDQGMPNALKAIHDSKKLTPKKRALLFELISGHPEIHFGLAQVGAVEIDQINILKATHRAMALAVESIGGKRPEHALVDGLPVHGLPVPHTAVVKGDAKSFSIAAASILAKEFRDRLMEEWDDEYPEYGFAQHKGYGTPQHRNAIREHGPCPLHRRSFLGNIEQQDLFQWDR